MKKLVLILLLILTFFNIENVGALEQEELKVMVIEINPTIKRISNHPKVSDYFEQDVDAVINELKEDLEYTSHNYLKVNIVDHEYLDEYPKYTKQVELVNGSKAYQLDEETYLSKAGYDGSPTGDWYNLLASGIFEQIESYSFDYDYIVNKYNLIEKRKNGDFDQVWLVTIDPTPTYETLMVGTNPFWINGPGYVASCPNFMIANISISRRDANLHALGHGVEGTLDSVFGDYYFTYPAYGNRGTYRWYKTTYSSYEKDAISINPDNYNNLNYWEKFMLGTYSNKENYASVGNVHFPFNGTFDYDYETTGKVYTNWREWLNYPNITGKFELDNNNAWLENAGNNELGDEENKDSDRLYVRFWFYLMPHIEGYTKEGYLNNWWKYFTSLDFVTRIEPFDKQNYNVEENEEVKIKYVLKYNSGMSETKELNPNDLNVNISGDSVKIVDNKLMAISEGISNISVYHDNKKMTFTVIVGNDPQIERYSCEISGDNYYDKEGNITSKEMYEFECLSHYCSIEYNPSGFCFEFNVDDSTCYVDEDKKTYFYFGKDGSIVTKKTYEQECNKENKNICVIIDNKYYDKKGNEVSEKEYEMDCKKHSCEIIDDVYFDKDGNQVNKSQYVNSCPNNTEENPATGYFLPFLSLLFLAFGGVAIYFHTKKDNLIK